MREQEPLKNKNMWIYNKQKNEIYEAPEKETLEMTEMEYQGYLRSRRALQVKGDHKWGDGISREENVHFEIMDCSKWFWAVCGCGWEGSSEKLNGGGQIADTGDYSDAYCPVCSSTDYADEDLGNGVVAVPLSPVEETKMEVDYLKDISNEDKEKYIRGLMEIAGKEFVAAFIGLGLKTHMECMIIEENSKKEFVLSFRPFTEHLKRFPFEETPDLLNSDKNVKECDASKDASSNKAGSIKEKTDAAGTQIKQ